MEKVNKSLTEEPLVPLHSLGNKMSDELIPHVVSTISRDDSTKSDVLATLATSQGNSQYA